MTKNSYKVIHKFTAGHLGQLLKLYRDEWWIRDRQEEDVKKMLSNTTYIFGISDEKEEKLYGFARVLSDQVYFALIFDLMVAKDHRNKGIGTFIIESIKNHFILKIEYLELCCRQELIPFYQKHGFKLSDGRINIVKSSSVR